MIKIAELNFLNYRKKEYAIGKLSRDKHFFNLGMKNEETHSKDRIEIKKHGERLILEKKYGENSGI